MYTMTVSGEIKALAWKEGSSGIFTGSIEGLYQGYRFASTTPDEQHFVLEAQNGTIALTLHQEIVTPLPPRPAEHPFAEGKDPLAHAPVGVAHGLPSGAGPADTDAAAGKKPFIMQVELQADPQKSTGIFAGATGAIELETPAYRMAGYLVINTRDGDLRLTFLEKRRFGVLDADLRVDGERSTGIYKHATGELMFSLTTWPPNFGRGTYEGTIRLGQAPARAVRAGLRRGPAAAA
jgi:hypothetical protein